MEFVFLNEFCMQGANVDFEEGTGEGGVGYGKKEIML